jgi:MFS family permease
VPTFAASIAGSILFRLGVGATPFLLPLLLQIGFGMSPFQSGTITFASAIGAIAMKFVAPPTLRRFGFRTVLVANAVLAGLFVMLPATFSPATPVMLMTGLLLVGGFFRSLQFTGVNALAYADMPPERMSRATALTSVAQQLALSLGISVGATGGTISATTFAPAFVVVGFLSMLSAIPFTLLARDAGDEMSGRRPIAPDPVTAMRERG